MKTQLAVLSTGLVTSVGLNARASCAAIRAKVNNSTETRFVNANGDWIVGHEVPLEKPWRGLDKLTRMAVMVIEEALAHVPKIEWPHVPLLLCTAEPERPGREEGLDDGLLRGIQQAFAICFSAQTAVLPQGRIAVATALLQARALIEQMHCDYVLIVAADSLLNGATIDHYEREDRLLTTSNSNGFMPGEAAGALLLGKPSSGPYLACTGLGFSVEAAHIYSAEPLRAEGLTQAIRSALAEADCEMHKIDFRITDLAGEHYYFKEAALALSRILRRRKETFDLWHPAECTGEVGAAVGISIIALADAACRKRYTKGPSILAHMANDGGQRAAIALQFWDT